MIRIFLLFSFLLGCQFTYSQGKPKLVVGIVVDQMRQDYLLRYMDDYGNDGFKRLLNEGYVFRNAHYNYFPTKTGPGHASIYTGTTPAKHGVIGNDWYDREIGRNINCVEDTLHQAVGAKSNGEVSPVNVKTTTITDELRLFYNFRSKVVSVSLKDRGASIPGGHNPTGAYWYCLEDGNMMTSTYYMDKLPEWAEKFNRKNRSKALLSEDWELLRPFETYNESIEDENNFEQEISKGLGTTFPYNLSKYKDKPALLKYTPYTNTLIKEFAFEAVKAESLGMDDIPDFLAISFSATDDLGHRYGPRSLEIQDTYLRLDLEIAELLAFLDEQIGKNEYTVFLTSDHGATDVPSYLIKNKMPGGYHNYAFFRDLLKEKLNAVYGEGNWVKMIINEQIYLNRELIKEKGISFTEMQEKVKEILLSEDYVEEAFLSDVVGLRMFTDPTLIKLQNGFDAKRSGDVLFLLSSSDLNDSYGRQGTDHRTGYTYDTHVPIIFYGKGINKGVSFRQISITDIAPTLSMFLDISLPSGSNGQVLEDVFTN